jgi:Zn-dependent peptidase ImmA (M78 family)
LLAPIRLVRPDLIGGRITLERLVQIKKFWKVSVASLLFRASRSKIITDNQSSYLWRQLSARGWRKREPDETQFSPETPRIYEKILTLHEKELGYDANDISRLLRISLNEVRHLYGIATPDETRRRLRIVK